VTTRGIREAEAAELANWVADILDRADSVEAVDRVRTRVLDLCARFPVYARPAQG
jgi:glycine hydroxymethyltransferase